MDEGSGCPGGFPVGSMGSAAALVLSPEARLRPRPTGGDRGHDRTGSRVVAIPAHHRPARSAADRVHPDMLATQPLSSERSAPAPLSGKDTTNDHAAS